MWQGDFRHKKADPKICNVRITKQSICSARTKESKLQTQICVEYLNKEYVQCKNIFYSEANKKFLVCFKVKVDIYLTKENNSKKDWQEFWPFPDSLNFENVSSVSHRSGNFKVAPQNSGKNRWNFWYQDQ